MSEIQFICQQLNEPPFLMNLSNVAFDEKSPFIVKNTRGIT